MPRDNSGVYSLPIGYVARPGETIQPSQHNPPLEDIAAALTDSLPRSGVAAMTAPLKLVSGSAASPSLTFSSGSQTGFYLKGDGTIGISVNGVEVGSFDASGLAGGVPVGAVLEWYEDALPSSSYVWANGAAIPREEFAPLFDRWGTRFGAGNGTTTFNVIDKREYVSVGKATMGGTTRPARVPQYTLTTLGGVYGESQHTLETNEIPPVTPSGSVDISHEHYTGGRGTGIQNGAGVSFTFPRLDVSSDGSAGQTFGFVSGGPIRTLSMNQLGYTRGTHNNLQLSQVANFIIRAR